METLEIVKYPDPVLRMRAHEIESFDDDLRRPDALLATPKHFAGYPAVRGGMEYGPVELGPGALRETFLPPFAAAFAAGARATMAAFSAVDGVPATVYRANYAFKAIRLPAGSHVVRFEFRTLFPLLYGLYLFLKVAVIGWVLFYLWRRRWS